MFGDVVLGIEHEEFEHELSAIKKAAGAKFDIELTAAHLKELVTKYKAVYVKNKQVLPEDPWEQLRMGVDAVFRCGAGCGCTKRSSQTDCAEVDLMHGCGCVLRGWNCAALCGVLFVWEAARLIVAGVPLQCS